MFIPLPHAEEIDSPQYRLVRRFLTEPFWQDAFDGLFDPNIIVDFPHAPPGMLQHLDAFEFSAFRFWLRNTILEMEPAAALTILPTGDPNRFWAVRHSRGRVCWAKKNCRYENEHAVLIEVCDGKIAYIKDYFNPLAFYEALDIQLPAFRYDPKPQAENTRMPEGMGSRLTEAENRQRVMDNFLNPINFDASLEPIYTSDVQMVCPNVPYSMPMVYEGKDFDVENQWMFEVCTDMVSPQQVPYDLSPDGKWLVIQANCYLATHWSGHEGHYTQRELYIAYLCGGKIQHFRVYFNPVNKFSSMNQMIPSFPYFNF